MEESAVPERFPESVLKNSSLYFDMIILTVHRVFSPHLEIRNKGIDGEETKCHVEYTNRRDARFEEIFQTGEQRNKAKSAN